MSSPLPSPWTLEVEARLVELVKAGHTCQRISDAFTKEGTEVSRCAVIGKVRRLRACGVIPPCNRTREQKRMASRRGRAIPAPPSKDDNSKAAHAKRLKAASTTRERLARDPSLPSVEATVEIGDHQCRWIEGGAYCARQTAIHGTWCDEHRERVWEVEA